MSSSSIKSIVKPRPAASALRRARILPSGSPIVSSRPRLTAIRTGMIELGCLRLADASYPGPEVLEAVARRLLRG